MKLIYAKQEIDVLDVKIVKEGISFFALLFAPFVLLFHRLWEDFFFYCSLLVIMSLILSNNQLAFFSSLLSIFVSLELSGMREKKLIKAGYILIP